MALGTNDVQLGQLTAMRYAVLTNGTPGTPMPLSTLVSVDGPGTTVDEVETPLLLSTTKLYASGLPESEATFNIRHNNLNPAVIALRSAMKAYPVPSFQWYVDYPDGTTDTFQGFPKGYTVSGIEGTNPQMAAIPIRATTAITNAATGGS